MIALVVPIHLYPFDAQGSLDYKSKIKMYKIALSWMRKLYKDCQIIVCGHGDHPGKVFDEYIDHLIWSKDYELPNEFGLFEGNPAQIKIVSMGCKKALQLGCSHIIKVRGDGILYNAKLVLDNIKTKPDKLWITQQTSFIGNMLGDCYMYGPAKLVYDIWSKDNPVREKDGLINTALNFLDAINSKDWTSSLIRFCEFNDLSDLEVYDLRWNFKNNEESFVSDKFIGDDRFLWGSVNGWIKYKDFRICEFDRNIFFTKKLFYSRIFRSFYKKIPNSLEYRLYKFFQLIF